MTTSAATPAGLLDIESLDRSEIEAILERTRFFQPQGDENFRRLETLKGKSVVTLFFEASTRTRVSFEIAARRLGADTISIAAQSSSVSKGESLVDTLNTLVAMRPHAIVMRHAASGAPQFLARSPHACLRLGACGCQALSFKLTAAPACPRDGA